MAAPRDPRIVLEQMLEAVSDIEQITAKRSFEDSPPTGRPGALWSAAYRVKRVLTPFLLIPFLRCLTEKSPDPISLTAILGRPVDLAFPDAMRPLLRKLVLRDAVEIF